LQHQDEVRPGVLDLGGGHAADQAGGAGSGLGLELVHTRDRYRSAGAHGVDRIVDRGVGTGGVAHLIRAASLSNSRIDRAGGGGSRKEFPAQRLFRDYYELLSTSNDSIA
jgi:hypothetical protein